MRKIFILVMVSLVLGACGSDNNIQNANAVKTTTCKLNNEGNSSKPIQAKVVHKDNSIQVVSIDQLIEAGSKEEADMMMKLTDEQIASYLGDLEGIKIKLDRSSDLTVTMSMDIDFENHAGTFFELMGEDSSEAEALIHDAKKFIQSIERDGYTCTTN